MIRTFLYKASESGVSHASSVTQKRNIRLANHISLVLMGACAFILLFRTITGTISWWLIWPLLGQMVIYSIPLVLNCLGFVNVSRILICWLPSLVTFATAIISLSKASMPESSTYVGFRLYLIAFGSFPLLVFSLSEKRKLFTAASIPVLILLFLDPMLAFFGVGYWQNGLNDPTYSLNSFRAVVALGVTNLAIFFLKRIIEKNDRLNTSLLDELREKNKQILQRAANEVTALDEKLHVNLHLLKERVKELRTLHSISQLLQDEKKPVDDLMQGVVIALPDGWQHPEITATRILIEGRDYKTPNYAASLFSQTALFDLPDNIEGRVEVVYLEERPPEFEGPFLKEERDLIETIADMLGSYFAKRHESAALKKSEATLHAIINNTDTLIWSVDKNLKVIGFNKPFFNHIRKHYSIETKIGEPLFTQLFYGGEPKLTAKWEHYFNGAMAGKIGTFEETRFGIDFHVSVSPIVEEDGSVSGVTVFADDITYRKQRERELVDAHKKIGELKLMALRSVMNPHFIFNALNSIQSFIAKNDRLNAISYLSTFSKLIRSILNNSVANRIKLTDEIDMLKNYIQLEMVRFEGKFDFKLSIDKSIESDNVEIPSLLIQPYVENAILHGLCNKDGKGILKINVFGQKDAVLFEIEDNGIGRQAAMQLQRRKFANHKSMGTRLTEERLRLINENHKVLFAVEDLETQGIACGTKVTINVAK